MPPQNPPTSETNVYAEFGWYFKNTVARSKVNWYFPAKSATMTVGSIQGLYLDVFNCSNTSNDNMPFLTVYTLPTGSGDYYPGFFHSSMTYIFNNTPSVNTSYLGFIPLGASAPDIYNTAVTNMIQSPINNPRGTYASNQIVEFFSFGSNSGSTTNSVEFVLNKFGIITNTTQEFIMMPIGIGVTGPAGPVGQQGVQGSTGSSGQVGATGMQGTQGSTGSSGQVGETGQVGSTGQVGATGQVGSTGQVGATGMQGVQGPTGQFGGIVYSPIIPYNGDNGFTAGTEGAMYSQIDLGNTGARFRNLYVQDIFASGNTIHLGNGSSISVNDNGTIAMPAGTTIGGVNTGSIVIKGTVDYLSDLPANASVGDGYIFGLNLYVFSETSGWVDLGIVKGPQGNNGIQGIQGIAGPAGPAGPACVCRYCSVPCFLEGTLILCLNSTNSEVYVPIQNLRKGDMIKTFKHGYVPLNMIGYSQIYNSGNSDRIQNRLYRCSKNRYPQLDLDLIITGSHAILVDEFRDGEREHTTQVLSKIYITDRKYRLPACVDRDTIPYEIEGTFTVYHIALDNTDYYMNYGIYAQGLLVETCSKRYLSECSNMTFL